MQTTDHPETTGYFVANAQRIRDFLKLFPQGIKRAVVVIDPASQPEPLLAMVLALAEQWYPQIILLHGGRLLNSGLAVERSDRDDLVDLLCLGWDFRNRYSDMSISRSIVRSELHVFALAAEYKADVILVPEALAACFQPRAGSDSEPGHRGLPCTMVIVAPVDDADW